MSTTVVCAAATGDRHRCTWPATDVRDDHPVCGRHRAVEWVQWEDERRSIIDKLNLGPIVERPRQIALKTVPEPPSTSPRSSSGSGARWNPTRRGRPTSFDTEAVAAEIARDGLWPVVGRHGLSYGHALRIRRGWRPKKPYQPAAGAHR